MRILFVAAQSVHTIRWISQLRGQPWDIHIFPWADAGISHPELAGVTVHRLVHETGKNGHARQTGIPWPLPRGGDRLRGVLTRLGTFGQPQRLARLILRLRPDIVHALEMQRCGYLTLAARQLLVEGSFPYWIYSCWGNDIFFFARNPAHADRVRQVLANCDGYIADCQRDVTLAREFGLRGEVLGVFPVTGGFDLERMRGFRAPGRISSRRMIALKGYHNQEYGGRALVALEGLCRVRELLNGYEVVIFSANEVVRAEAPRVAGTHGLKITVMPASSNDEILKVMGRSRIAIGVGVTDGTPISMLEAMTVGAFPVQSDTISTQEWIRDGENGLLVPPENPEAIAAALRHALTDDKLVNRATELNTALTSERIDAKVVRPKVITMYEAVTKRDRALAAGERGT